MSAAPILQHFERPFPVSVRGIVIDGFGDVVRGAAVNILFGGNPVGRAEASEDGAFLMSDLQLKAGLHRIRAFKPGYITVEEEFNVTESMANATLLFVLRLNQRGWTDITRNVLDLRTPSAATAAERRSQKQRYAVVDVFFATDRKFDNVRNIYQRFGGTRSPDGTTSYGICQVSIPEGHRIGQLENPIFKLMVMADPERHVVVLDMKVVLDTLFYASVRTAVQPSEAKDIFVFVHGYNVTFPEAVRRTAQIAFDLNFKGAPICYSWPSAGEFSKYPADEASVEWSTEHFATFLTRMARDSEAATIHLIAHSMGSRAVANGLRMIADSASPPGACRLKQIILAAPDIDSGLFTQLSGKAFSCGERTSLYASSNDLALGISQQLHAYPRAGASGPAITIVPGVDTIDASQVDTGLVGHSYYRGRTALADIYELIKHGTPPPRFGLRQVNTARVKFTGRFNVKLILDLRQGRHSHERKHGQCIRRHWLAEARRAPRKSRSRHSHRRNDSRPPSHSGARRPHLKDRSTKNIPPTARPTLRIFHRTPYALPDSAGPRCRDRR
jgi:esterase/lipase superfamily enzyme